MNTTKYSLLTFQISFYFRKIDENLRIDKMSGGTKLFVYGVNRSCPKDILEDKFAKIGAVSDVYITEKGYAFVTMADEGDAQAAVDELNGTRYIPRPTNQVLTNQLAKV